MSRSLVLAASLVALAACTKDQPTPDFETPAAPASPMPAKFTQSDFTALRFLEGTWQGTMANGNHFYESYRFVDDSTIARGGHTDSTFRTKSDSSRIVFRNGAVIDSGASSASVAEKLDSTMVDFRSGPTYHFTWTKDGPDAWTARLFAKQADGTERVTTYPMKRIKGTLSPEP